MMNLRSGKLIVSLGAILVLCLPVFSQILPGQVPAGPPPQPGQLGPAPKAAGKIDTPTASSSQPIIGDLGTDNGPLVGVVTKRTVLVPTTVLDPDGHGYVNGILANEFELYDNDRQQRISAEFTQLPMSVAMVVQANAEVEPFLPKLRKTGILLHGLVTGENGDVAILAFDHRMTLLQDFTQDPEKIDDAMQKLNAGSSSARLVDAVLEADHMLKRHDLKNTRRHVILVISRNVDKGSEAHLQATVRQMQFDNVIVYCVDISKVLSALLKKAPYPAPTNGRIPPEAQPNILGNGPRTQTSNIQEQTGNILDGAPPIIRGIHDLFKKTPAEAFSYFTGGQIYSFATEKALENAITDIGKDLNSQYLLSYTPNPETAKEPGFHTIKVDVARPGLKVRVRPGYWWGGGTY